MAKKKPGGTMAKKKSNESSKPQEPGKGEAVDLSKLSNVIVVSRRRRTKASTGGQWSRIAARRRPEFALTMSDRVVLSER